MLILSRRKSLEFDLISYESTVEAYPLTLKLFATQVASSLPPVMSSQVTTSVATSQRKLLLRCLIETFVVIYSLFEMQKKCFVLCVLNGCEHGYINSFEFLNVGLHIITIITITEGLIIECYTFYGTFL